MRSGTAVGEPCRERQNKQLHKVNSAMMRNVKVDAQVVIKLSNISN